MSVITFGTGLASKAQVDEEHVRARIKAALDVGITSFDAADVYGNTAAESILGRALAGQRRESLEIFTKVFFPTGPGGPNDRGLGRKHIVESCEASLRRLQTDHIDVYQAHRFDRTVPLEETFSAFADLVHQGKVLYLGVSEWTAEQITRGAALARELRVPFVANEPQYSMLWRVIEPQIVPACVREGLGQVVFSPIAQGVLTGKYQPGAAAPAGSRARRPTDEGNTRLIDHFLRDDVLERVQRLAPLADQAGLSMAQLAVAWVLQNPNVSSAVCGASRPEQIPENAKVAGVKLENDLMTQIDSVLDGVVESNPGIDQTP